MRVLLAIEARMRTNELVPIAQLRNVCRNGESELKQVLRTLGKQTLTHQETGNYRLTYHGQDAIALKELAEKQRIISGLGSQMGCGKESDLYVCQSTDGDDCILKLHRLGRTSFKKGVKQGRDYIKNYKHNVNWLTMSTLSAKSEAKFMEKLADSGFRVPKFYGMNRHAIVMGAVPGKTLCHLRKNEIQEPALVLEECLNIICRLAEHGLIHGDFNDFNLMLVNDNDLESCTGVHHTEEDKRRYSGQQTEDEKLDDSVNHFEKIVMIDFPQMVSIDHPNAREYFQRDVTGILNYFREYDIDTLEVPTFEEIVIPILEKMERDKERDGRECSSLDDSDIDNSE